MLGDLSDPALSLVTSTEPPTKAVTAKRKPKKKATEPPLPDLVALAGSWQLALRAARKSPETIKSYTTAMTQYLAYCAEHDLPAALDRRVLDRFIDHLLTSGAQPSTAVSRQLGVRQFSAWLTEEGELDGDPLLGVKPPKLDTKVVEPLTDAQLKALLKACAGKELRDRRDEALVRFMGDRRTGGGGRGHRRR